jgi:hypothetical protein
MNTRVVAFGAFAIWLAASGDADPTKPTAVSGDLDGDGGLLLVPLTPSLER